MPTLETKSERSFEFRVGALVVATIAITAVLLLLFGAPSRLFQRRYTVYVEMPSAHGVNIGTPVTKQGIKVGEVTGIEFSRGGGVRVRVAIDGSVKIPRTDVCVLRESLFGDAELEFSPRERPAPPSVVTRPAPIGA